MSGLSCENLTSVSWTETNIVLLHGWSFDREVWRECLAQLRLWANVTVIDLPGSGASSGCANPETLIESILAEAPARAIYVGWSLGGSLATLLAAQNPERVEALITLATNPCFVEKEGWTQAMSGQDFSQFQSLIETRPEAGLRRFDSLQTQGADDSLRQKQWLRKVRPDRYVDIDLLQGLQWLEDIDNRAALEHIQCPVLHIFADRDELIPRGVADQIRQLNPNHEVKVITGASHLLLWNRADQLTSSWQDFWQRHCSKSNSSKSNTDCHARSCDQEVKASIDKTELAKSFSRAAPTYDNVAQLQRRIGTQLLEHYGQWMDRGPHLENKQRQHRHPQDRQCQIEMTEGKVVLDLGSGTGYFAEALQKQCLGAEYIGFDLAEGMLAYARCHSSSYRSSNSLAYWCCGDAENLPFAASSVDLIFSSLAIQWCENLAALFNEIHRVLRPGGVCLFSTLGPSTLGELRRAWQSADDYTHVNTFTAVDTLKELIDARGFSEHNLAEEKIILEYRELKELTSELKYLGAHNLNRGRQVGLTSRSKLRKFKAAYEDQRIDGKLPATYEVYYGVLRK